MKVWLVQFKTKDGDWIADWESELVATFFQRSEAIDWKQQRKISYPETRAMRVVRAELKVKG